MLSGADVDTHEALLALTEDTSVTLILSELHLQVLHVS